jgi:mRNA-degrading endonuclease YafQ of YafQ-DinJ toxin-antitoxin module
MQIGLSTGFQADVRSLGPEERSAVFEVILSLPRALGVPHTHSGLGLRKIHRSGVWEARLGLGLRLVFTLEANVLTLVRVGTHDEVRRYLRSL